MKLKLAYLLIIAGLISSCSESEETPRGEFAQGVFVVNEGNFSSSNGSVSHFNEGSEETTQDIFAEANGTAVGGLIQSLYFHGDKAFIIDNLGSKIYVVNAETFELIHTIEDGLVSPRYMTVLDGVAYVSNWGLFDENFNLSDSYVAVIDLESFEVVSSIATDSGCEGLLAFGGMIYVANSFSNTIDVIKPGSEAVFSEFEVAPGPISFVEDSDGKVWVLGQSYDPLTWAPSGSLTRLDMAAEEEITSFTIAGGVKSLNIDTAGDNLYYIFNASDVIRTPITASSVSNDIVFSGTSFYGLGIHPVSGQFYVANAGDFESNGTVQIFEGSAEAGTFPSGVTPNGFVFR